MKKRRSEEDYYITMQTAKEPSTRLKIDSRKDKGDKKKRDKSNVKKENDSLYALSSTLGDGE